MGPYEALKQSLRIRDEALGRLAKLREHLTPDAQVEHDHIIQTMVRKSEVLVKEMARDMGVKYND